MKPSALAAKAISEMYGDACAVFDPDCMTCQVWAWFRASCEVRGASKEGDK